MAYILRQNLEAALETAILAEERMGRGRMAIVDGWRDVLREIKNGENIDVIPMPPWHQTNQ